MPSNVAASNWWRTGVALPSGARLALHVVGGAVMVFAVWARLQALYLSERVLVVFALLMAAGFVLVLLAQGWLRATGLTLLLLSAPELMHYYAYGLNSTYAGTVFAVVCLVAGLICLMRASNGAPIINIFKQTN